MELPYIIKAYRWANPLRKEARETVVQEIGVTADSVAEADRLALEYCVRTFHGGTLANPGWWGHEAEKQFEVVE